MPSVIVYSDGEVIWLWNRAMSQRVYMSKVLFRRDEVRRRRLSAWNNV